VRTTVTIDTENAAESLALFKALSGMDTAKPLTPVQEDTKAAGADTPLYETVWSMGESPSTVTAPVAPEASSPVLMDPVVQTAQMTPTPSPVQPEVKRTRKPKQPPAPAEVAPTTGPSPTNPGPSVDLTAALDAAGAVTIEGDPVVDLGVSGETVTTGVDVQPEDDSGGEQSSGDLDDLMGDMLSSPGKSESKPETPAVMTKAPVEVAEPTEAEAQVHADGDPRDLKALHQAVRDDVILKGGAWLRDVLGGMKINRISDLTRDQVLKVLAMPAPTAEA
jgi:hypothetical protein